jgi:S1-C subfamily serine protease
MATYERNPGSPLAGYFWPLLLFVLLLGLVIWRFGYFWRSSGPAQPRTVAARGDLAADEKATIELYRKVAPSVVHITSLQQRRDRLNLNAEQVPRGTGSGFIWDKDGNVVTNFHVVQGGNAWKVTLSDHNTYPAAFVGAYPDKDLAVLRIGATSAELQPIEIGTSSDLQVGQKVFAIGNPFGLDQTLTTGIISAVNREIESVTKQPIKGVIQTDAAINPGNSGGPLLDSAGRLIGVNTAIFSPSGASVGIGFAIPVDEVNRIVPQLINHGKVVRPSLGVQVATDRTAREHGRQGVLVLAVQPDGPADKAGIRSTRVIDDEIVLGDEILAIDGKPVRSTRDFFATLENYKVGDTVKLTVRRQGQTVELTARLDVSS